MSFLSIPKEQWGTWILGSDIGHCQGHLYGFYHQGEGQQQLHRGHELQERSETGPFVELHPLQPGSGSTGVWDCMDTYANDLCLIAKSLMELQKFELVLDFTSQ